MDGSIGAAPVERVTCSTCRMVFRVMKPNGMGTKQLCEAPGCGRAFTARVSHTRAARKAGEAPKHYHTIWPHPYEGVSV